MAVGRSILIERTSPLLSPTEGKFRVKGHSRGGPLGALFLYRNAPQRNEGGHFQYLRCVPAGLRLFSLGIMVVITENASS